MAGQHPPTGLGAARGVRPAAATPTPWSASTSPIASAELAAATPRPSLLRRPARARRRDPYRRRTRSEDITEQDRVYLGPGVGRLDRRPLLPDRDRPPAGPRPEMLDAIGEELSADPTCPGSASPWPRLRGLTVADAMPAPHHSGARRLSGPGRGRTSHRRSLLPEAQAEIDVGQLRRSHRPSLTSSPAVCSAKVGPAEQVAVGSRPAIARSGGQAEWGLLTCETTPCYATARPLLEGVAGRD